MARAGFNLVRMRAPIIRPLTGVAIIMCYLAAVSLASAVGVGRWVAAWQEQANLKMSIYIPPIENDALIASHTKKINTLLDFLGKQEGIKTAQRVSKQEIAVLLAPWIGKQIDLTHMPVMDLIDITLSPQVSIDEKKLRAEIKALVPSAALENHQQWRVAIENWVLLVQVIAGLILLATLACMTAVISLAAHATIDANRQIVSIFHLIGAEDDFVVKVFRRYFIRLGLFAGLCGSLGAFATFMAGAQLWKFVPPSLHLSAIGIALTPIDYAALALIPALACLIAMTSSRKQALAHLSHLP